MLATAYEMHPPELDGTVEGSTAPENTSRARPVALLLHGMSLNPTIFPKLHLPTIAPDLCRLNLGEDGDTAELRRYRMGAYARLLDDETAAAASWRSSRRIVVGHSFGGMLALSWLLEHGGEEPARVDGLVLIATTAGPMFERVRVRLLQRRRREWRVGVGSLARIWNRPIVTRAVKRLLCGGRLGATRVDFRSARIQSDVDLDLAGWRNTDWRAMRSYRLAMDGFDVRERLSEISVPTIVLHGTKDFLFDTEAARDLARRLPDAELRIVEGAGHALPLTHGSELIRAVTDLLAG